MDPDLSAALSLLQEAQANLDAARTRVGAAHNAHMAEMTAEALAASVFADAQRQFLTALRAAGDSEPVKLRVKAG
jgi:hypothetical protein